jgi:hypothetical protein
MEKVLKLKQLQLKGKKLSEIRILLNKMLFPFSKAFRLQFQISTTIIFSASDVYQIKVLMQRDDALHRFLLFRFLN